MDHSALHRRTDDVGSASDKTEGGDVVSGNSWQRHQAIGHWESSLRVNGPSRASEVFLNVGRLSFTTRLSIVQSLTVISLPQSTI